MIKREVAIEPEPPVTLNYGPQDQGYDIGGMPKSKFLRGPERGKRSGLMSLGERHLQFEGSLLSHLSLSRGEIAVRDKVIDNAVPGPLGLTSFLNEDF